MPESAWRQHEVTACQYSALADTELLAASRESIIDDPETHVGQQDVWFRVGEKGFAGVWEPGNVNGRLRLAPCFVHPAFRGQSVGEALVRARVRYGLARPDIESLDTYAHNPGLFVRLGFEDKRSYQFGTHYLYYEK